MKMFLLFQQNLLVVSVKILQFVAIKNVLHCFSRVWLRFLLLFCLHTRVQYCLKVFYERGR